MSWPSTSYSLQRRKPAVPVVRPQGLARDLPILLYGQALILLVALALSGWRVSLTQAITQAGALAVLSLLLIAWFAIQNWGNLNCQAFLVLEAGWAYWYFVPMFSAALRGGVSLDGQPHEFTPHQIVQGCSAVLLAIFISTLVYQLVLVRPVWNMERITGWLNRRSISVPVAAVAVLLGLGLLPFALSGKPLMTAILGSRSADGIFPKSNLGGAGAAGFLLTYFLTTCCLLGFYRFLIGARGVAKWVCLLLALTSLTVSAVGLSTRTMLLASVMPMLTVYTLGSPDRWKMVKVLACLAGLWVGADLVVSSRQQGFQELRENEPTEKRSRNLVDNDFYAELLFTMEVVPSQIPFSYESPMAYTMISVIPRALWPDKPTARTGERVMRLRMPDPDAELSGNLLPGIIGQYWEVAGWLGVLVSGMWLGAAIALLDLMICTSQWPVRYFVFAFVWALFISFRTFAFSNLFPSLICMSIVLSLSRTKRPVTN